MDSNSTKLPKIAIIGGGPGGLLLTRLLQQNNIPVTTYELEASIDARSQGGCLDLHEESGQKAVKAAGLWPEVEKALRYEGEDMKILDKSGKLLYNEVNEGKAASNRPEIDRLQLRDIFLKSIKPELIQWGHKLKKVEQGEGGKYDLHFDDKVEKGFDLVIGADGAWSKVRQLLTDVKPDYSGVSMIEVRFGDVDNKQPEVSKLVGRGSLLALGSGQGHLAQRNGDGSIKNYITLKVPENYLKECGIDFSNTKEVKAKLLEAFKDWDSSFNKLIEHCDDDVIPRALYMLPVGHTWVNKPGLTLLGDAAHLMTPFAGEGVNLALIDALELSEAIVKNINNLNDGVVEYEKTMCERAKEKAELTASNLVKFFAEDAPREIVEFMLSGQPPSE